MVLEACLEKNLEVAYDGYKAFKDFSDPHNEKWICCPFDKKPVTPVREHRRKVGEKNVFVISHFRLIDENAGGCSSGESDIHRNLKILIANFVENSEFWE